VEHRHRRDATEGLVRVLAEEQKSPDGNKKLPLKNGSFLLIEQMKWVQFNFVCA
jgi:hypothetical protein